MQVPDQGTDIYPALDLYDRINQFWRQVLPSYIGKTLLLVVHGGTNRALISTALGITPDRYHCIQQSNCGISVLDFPDGTLKSGRLEIMNLASHVGENIPKAQEGGKGLRLLLVPTGAYVKQVNNITQQLKGVSIGFCLIDTHNDSQTLAQAVIKQHPEIVYLNVLDSSELQKEISCKITDSNHLVNVLVVAEEKIIKSLIAEAIGMDMNEKYRLQVKPGTICSIQYPGKHHPPILQAMNLYLLNELQSTQSQEKRQKI
jgi:probable phosphoglycerate mutase